MAYDRAAALPVYSLRFEEYPGLTVRARRPGFNGERALRVAWPILCSRRAGVVAQERALVACAQAMGGALVDWDLEWDGERVPATAAGLLMLDTVFLLELVRVWVDRVAAQSTQDNRLGGGEPEVDPAVAVLAELPVEILDPEPDAELAETG